MKRTFSIEALVLFGFLCTRAAVAQSWSLFGLTNFYPPVDAPVFDAEGTALGPDYSAELWGGLSSDSLVPALDVSTRQRLIVPFLGAGYFGLAPPSVVVSAQLQNGGYSWLQVRAWDSRLGSTYEQVAAQNIGGYGESAVFYADGADPDRILPDLPAPLIGLESFSLRPVVPEPSTWAMLGIGSLILWFGARRSLQLIKEEAGSESRLRRLREDSSGGRRSVRGGHRQGLARSACKGWQAKLARIARRFPLASPGTTLR